MNSLILEQYTTKPNLLEYFGAFIQEVDFLLENIERVYLGRFLEYAQGEQLDILGDIVGQNRAISLDPEFFGFLGAAGALGMADEALGVGGIFLDGDLVLDGAIPLGDEAFRRVIRAKAYLNMAPVPDLETAYKVIVMLIGKVPRTLSIVQVTDRAIRIDLSTADVGDTEVTLIEYFTKYFVTNTVTYTINLV